MAQGAGQVSVNQTGAKDGSTKMLPVNEAAEISSSNNGGTKSVASADEPSETKSNWIRELNQKAGQFFVENPMKATVVGTVVGGTIKDSAPKAAKWALDKGKVVFAAKAQQKVEESVGDEAVAHATGAVSTVLGILGKAFTAAD